MRLGGHLVGVGDRRHRRLGVAVAVRRQQRRQLGRRGRLVMPPPGQDAVDRSHLAPYILARIETLVVGEPLAASEVGELDQETETDDRAAEAR